MLNVIGIVVSIVFCAIAVILFFSLLKFIILGVIIGLVTSVIFGSFWWGFIPCVLIGLFALGGSGESSRSTSRSSVHSRSRNNSSSDSDGLRKDVREMYEYLLNQREYERTLHLECLKFGDECKASAERNDSEDDMRKAEEYFRDAEKHRENVESLDRQIDLLEFQNNIKQ